MEYKGELKGFPTEVVEKMLERQVEQGNDRNISVFERSKAIYINGFDWASSPEGHSFWEDVIKDENFDTFFAKYPKTTYPKVMMVSDSGDSWLRRVVFMEKNGRFLAWSNAETPKSAEGEYRVVDWKLATDIKPKPEPQPVEITIDQIAQKFGITPEQVKIKK